MYGRELWEELDSLQLVVRRTLSIRGHQDIIQSYFAGFDNQPIGTAYETIHELDVGFGKLRKQRAGPLSTINEQRYLQYQDVFKQCRLHLLAAISSSMPTFVFLAIAET
jgi:hypothetical protein